MRAVQDQDQDSLLVKRRNDNHSLLNYVWHFHSFIYLSNRHVHSSRPKKKIIKKKQQQQKKNNNIEHFVLETGHKYAINQRADEQGLTKRQCH